MTERTVWRGAPSQLVNLDVYLLCLLTAFLIFPVFIALYRWLYVRCVRYELTTERLRISWGILNRRVDDIELYRVRDLTLVQPFVQRLFGLGRIELFTADTSMGAVILDGLAEAEELRDQIRYHVEQRRARKGIRDIDLMEIAPDDWYD